MRRFPHQLSACALAAAALLTACGGGGDASAPTGGAAADTVAPTVAITDNITATTATGNVTFTFTFSEAVSGFDATDITVTGGAKGTFAMTGQTATLVVTPTANSTGTVVAEVAAGKFADAAGNANAGAASGSQAFNTTIPVVAYVSFDEDPAVISGMGAYGGALPSVETGPAGSVAKALKIVKPTSPDTWGGVYFNVPRVPFTATKKGMTAKVYSSVANSVIRLKVEVPGGANVEVAGTAMGAANTWTTVTWDFNGIDLNAQYTVLAITPDSTRTTDGATYYIDELQIVDTPAAPVVAAFTSLSFDEVPSPTLTDFGTNTAPPELVADPGNAANKVLKVYKVPGSEQWAGVTVSTGATFSIAKIPFTATAKTMTLRVYSPAAGVRVRLKVENAADGTISCETDALTTTSGAWETLTFNFAVPGTSPPVGGGATSALDLTKTYNKASIFSDFGLGNGGGTLPASRVYYYDSLTFVP